MMLEIPPTLQNASERCMLVVLMWCKAGALSLFARPNKVVLAAAFAVDVEGLEVERTKSTAG